LNFLAKDDTTHIASNLLELNELYAILSNGDEIDRENAIDTIGKIGLASATGWLIEVLKDVKPSLRQKAVSALGKLGKGAVSPLISALKCKNRNMRVGVVEALGLLRDRKAAEPLLISLGDEERIVRQNTAWALGRFNLSPDRYKTLRGKIIRTLAAAITKDEYLPVRFNAVYSLGRFDDIRIVKPLLEALVYPEFEMRLNASYGFMQAAIYLHDKASSHMHAKIIDNLTHALSDEVNLVRYNAADAIRLNGGPKALGILTTLLKDKDEYMRKIAERGIGELTPLKGKRPNSWSYSSRDRYGQRYRYELNDPDAIE
jgi:HEAT repeat protein